MNDVVKPLITFGILMGALGLPVTYAEDAPYRYTATLNEDGKYCARVKIQDYSGERKKNRLQNNRSVGSQGLLY